MPDIEHMDFCTDATGNYYQSLLIDATVMVSKNCPVTGDCVCIIFVAQ